MVYEADLHVEQVLDGELREAEELDQRVVGVEAEVLLLEARESQVFEVHLRGKSTHVCMPIRRRVVGCWGSAKGRSCRALPAAHRCQLRERHGPGRGG